LGRKLYKDFDAIGLKEDLEKIRYMDCLNFFEKQFKNPSKIINISKSQPYKTDIEFSTQKIEKSFEFGPYNDVLLEPTRGFGDKVSVCLISQKIEDDFSYVNFINNMLSLGLSSPFYSEIREKRGLVYHIGCHQSRMNNKGVNLINTETTEKNVDLLLDSFKDILNNPNKFVSKKRFDLIRKSYSIKYQKERINRYQNISDWINPPEWTVREILKTITYDKVMDVYDKYFRFDNFYVSNDRTEFN
jgi:hypothetical protein